MSAPPRDPSSPRQQARRRREQRLLAAEPRALVTWLTIGVGAQVVIYCTATGWPPRHAVLFLLGLIGVLMRIWFAWLSQERTLRYRMRGALGEALPAVVLTWALWLALWLLITEDVFMQRGTHFISVIVLTLLLGICDDPVRRYATYRLLHHVRADSA